MLNVGNLYSVLLALRRNEELPANPIEALTDYFGAYNNHKSSEMAVIAEEVEKMKVENKYLAEQIAEKEQELERAKIEKQEQEEAKRLAEEEEAKKKGGKKGAPPAAKKK